MQDDDSYAKVEDGYIVTDTSNINRFIAFKNPFRYRSYYYDEETKLYYLNSRYYDPQIGRFINADDIYILSEGKDFFNGLNLYSYCGNNPISNTDESGNAWWDWLISIFVAVAVIVAVVAVSVLTAGVGTAIAGALGGGVGATIFGSAVGGAITGAITGAIMSFGISVIQQGITNGYNNINWGQVGINTLIGAASGFVSGAIFGVISGSIKVANAAKLWDKGTFKSGYKSMKHHFQLNGGKGNTIIKFTKDAITFAERNGSNFSLLQPRPGLQAGWGLSKYFGIGANGLFTSSGKIITFKYFFNPFI